ncbi:Fic family protein [Deinococcus sp.]|uniref:Fic family protein n=1 Tax=Deinococcus sp. TaxID=47478 RepID=UPI0025FD0BF6|nr:Fic family protein [Deinococcus sp.]
MTVPDLARLDALNARLRSLPLPPALAASLDTDWEVVQTYNSNATEGNTLTLAETKAVLLDGITVSGHPLREHLEVVNHRQAWRLMRRLAAQPGNVTEDEVLSLHRVILTGIQTLDAGVYRRDRVRVIGPSRISPNPLKVPELVPPFLLEINADQAHPVLVAARLHYGLVAIQPFSGGNGHTARLLMNLWLIRSGFPPALLPVTERASYYAALEEANGGKLAPFEALIAERVRVALLELLEIVGG